MASRFIEEQRSQAASRIYSPNVIQPKLTISPMGGQSPAQRGQTVNLRMPFGLANQTVSRN